MMCSFASYPYPSGPMTRAPAGQVNGEQNPLRGELTMSNTTHTSRPRQRKSLQPATGTVAVLRPVGTVGTDRHTGEITINGKAYFLHLSETCSSLFGFDATHDAPTHYDVSA